MVDNGIEYLAMSLIFERTKTKQPTNVKVTKPRDIFLLHFSGPQFNKYKAYHVKQLTIFTILISHQGLLE